MELIEIYHPRWPYAPLIKLQHLCGKQGNLRNQKLTRVLRSRNLARGLECVRSTGRKKKELCGVRNRAATDTDSPIIVK